MELRHLRFFVAVAEELNLKQNPGCGPILLVWRRPTSPVVEQFVALAAKRFSLPLETPRAEI